MPVGPLLIGTVTLDRLYQRLSPSYRQALRFGGVVANAAFALGRLGAEPVLVSPRFSGDVGEAVGHQLRRHMVTWDPLDVYCELSFFDADLDEFGNPIRETFTDNGSFDVLDRYVCESALTNSASEIVLTCTDLSGDALAGLLDTADRLERSAWLLVSSSTEVAKVATGRLAHAVCMNLDELQIYRGANLSELPDIAHAARGIARESGVCVVTMGEHGALLLDCEQAWFQPVDPRPGVLATGAGDVLFAGFLRARLRGVDWVEALHYGTAVAQQFLANAVAPEGPYERLAEVSTTGLVRPERVSL